MDQEIAAVEKQLKECQEAAETRRQQRQEDVATKHTEAPPTPAVVWNERHAERLHIR